MTATPHCLLLHGLGGTALDLAPVARSLLAAGFAVSRPALPGHGCAAPLPPEAYLASGWRQWKGFVEDLYHKLRRQGPVLIFGYSLGGMLALDLAAHLEPGQDPAGICCLATPIFLRRWLPPWASDWRLFFLGFLARRGRIARLPARSNASRAIAPWIGHEDLASLAQLGQIEEALARLRPRLGEIRSPLCVISLAHDALCPPWQSRRLACACSSPRAELHILRVPTRRGGHLPAAHREAAPRVAELCVAFASSCSGRG